MRSDLKEEEEKLLQEAEPYKNIPAVSYLLDRAYLKGRREALEEIRKNMDGFADAFQLLVEMYRGSGTDGKEQPGGKETENA